MRLTALLLAPVLLPAAFAAEIPSPNQFFSSPWATIGPASISLVTAKIHASELGANQMFPEWPTTWRPPSCPSSWLSPTRLCFCWCRASTPTVS